MSATDPMQALLQGIIEGLPEDKRRQVYRAEKEGDIGWGPLVGRKVRIKAPEFHGAVMTVMHDHTMESGMIDATDRPGEELPYAFLIGEVEFLNDEEE